MLTTAVVEDVVVEGEGKGVGHLERQEPVILVLHHLQLLPPAKQLIMFNLQLI